MSEPRKRQRITGGTSSLSDTQDMSAASVQDQHVATTLAASVEARNVATTSDAQHILAANVEAQNVATNLAADVETQIVAAVPIANTAGHYLTANVAGVVCLKCNCPLQRRGSTLWIPEEKVIKNHWRQNECYVGDKVPIASKARKKLRDDQIDIHERILRLPDTAESYISKVFPSEHSKQSKKKCCTKCGFTSRDKPNFEKHYGKMNKYGCIKASHSSQDTIIINKNTGLRMPQKMIQIIIEGKFSLPYITRPPSYSYPQYAPPLQLSPPTAQLPPPPSVTQSQQSIPQATFHASQIEMEKVTSPHARPVAVKESETVNDSLQCFVNSSKTQTEQTASLRPCQDAFNNSSSID